MQRYDDWKRLASLSTFCSSVLSHRIESNGIKLIHSLPTSFPLALSLFCYRVIVRRHYSSQHSAIVSIHVFCCDNINCNSSLLLRPPPPSLFSPAVGCLALSVGCPRPTSHASDRFVRSIQFSLRVSINTLLIGAQFDYAAEEETEAAKGISSIHRFSSVHASRVR